MRLFKIDTDGVIWETETKQADEQVLEDVQEMLGTWIEVVSLPVIFQGHGQLIGLVSDIGAIDGQTKPNTLASQFYRVNGRLAKDMQGRSVMLWGDVYFATLDYNNPKANIKPLPPSYGIGEFADVLKRVVLSDARYLMV